ncbi:MAG: tandem-95 repeat protein, partial [Euryarchaeota archaeon]|nr:tandem-95 repeat protein [Euryarchaeota archaeon]
VTTVTFDLNVSSVNDAPVLTQIGNQETLEDESLQLSLSAFDVDQDALTFGATVQSGQVTATVTGTNLVLTPAANWSGIASIEVTVNDGNGGTDSEVFDLEVIKTNDLPVLATIGNQSTEEDTTLQINLSASDSDGDDLIFTAVVNSGDVVASVTGTVLSLVPGADWSGLANISITLDDGNGGTATEVIDLNVTPVNDAPVLALIGEQTTDEDITLSIPLVATDVEGDVLSFIVEVNSGDVTASINGQELVLVPTAQWSGTASITVIVDDGVGGTVSETFDLIVNAVNDAPVLAEIGEQTTLEDSPITLALSGTDTEQDPLTFSAEVVSGNVSADVDGTELSLMPDLDWSGIATIIVTLSDGNGGTDEETFDLVVTPVNDDPVLDNIDNQITNEDVPLNLGVYASDVEGDVLTYSASVDAGQATATITGTQLEVVPAQDWVGLVTITVSVDDGNGGSDSQTFELTVNPVNDYPVLTTIGTQVIEEDGMSILPLSATDADNDLLFYFAIVNYGRVSANVVGTDLYLIPAPDWNGQASITVIVDDANADGDPNSFAMEVFDVTVTPVNDAPV